MARIATSKGGGGFRPEIGTHNAVCVQIVDFGTHDKEWNGKVIGKVNRINLGFEFVDIELEGENGKYHPIWGEQYTNSIGKKASLRGLLEGWRGKPFTKEEEEGFDMSVLLGLSCTLVIQPNTKGNPKIQAIIKASGKFEHTRELHEFFVEEGCFDKPIPDWMPDWMKKEIENCYEFKDGFGAKPAVPVHDEPLPPDEDEFDVPF